MPHWWSNFSISRSLSINLIIMEHCERSVERYRSNGMLWIINCGLLPCRLENSGQQNFRIICHMRGASHTIATLKINKFALIQRQIKPTIIAMHPLYGNVRRWAFIQSTHLWFSSTLTPTGKKCNNKKQFQKRRKLNWIPFINCFAIDEFIWEAISMFKWICTPNDT